MNRDDLQAMAQRENERQQQYKFCLYSCAGTPCLSSGALAVQEALEAAITELNPEIQLQVVPTGCMGPCSRGPVVAVEETATGERHYYESLTPELARHLVVNCLSSADEAEPEAVTSHRLPDDWPFFIKQTKLVLSNSGHIDPERLESYVARGGYQSLAHTLQEMTPQEVCEAIKLSGLRGRGGGGYPTGLKWDLVRRATAERKYIIANGDEGDPGAYMDRTLMESDPHLILEGMAIAGYAVGAEQGFLYVRGEYPIASRRLEKAIRMAERRGLLGSRVLNSSFNFRIDVRVGAGAFVCGEETALMASIMGKRGQPVPRPPYPAESGLWGHPTLINNVETFGNIAPIIERGAAWYASIGTENSKGTKIFALAGKVNNTGLIEVPMGTSLREIVFDIGGGIPDDRPFKAAQTGGPSGGCIPADYLDTPVDYDKLKALGSIMGSGGLIVMDDQSCMPDVAKFFMEFCMDESCGKCVPCRVGTVQLFRLLERITNGSGNLADLDRLDLLSQMVRETSLCGLGQSAPNPVLSTLRYFRAEYEAHLSQHTCPAGVCQLNQTPIFTLQEVA